VTPPLASPINAVSRPHIAAKATGWPSAILPRRPGRPRADATSTRVKMPPSRPPATPQASTGQIPSGQPMLARVRPK